MNVGTGDREVSPSITALQEMCSRALARARTPVLRAEIQAISAQLEQPLQLAVAGAVSAGKSTLINAMLARPVAPADAGECTRVVTWYEYGEDDGAITVETRSGEAVAARLVDGRMPSELPVPVGDALRLRVRIRDPRLRTVTVIDTPGVNNVIGESEAATRRLLFGDRAAEQAQGLLYVMRHMQRFDADTLAEFRALSVSCGLTAVNTVAILSNVDRYGDDPWPTAARLADRAAEGLRGSVLDVAPVAALLAETGRARLLDDSDLAALGELAALRPAVLDDALTDLTEFASGDAIPTVPAARRRRLARLLHRYGIRRAAAFLAGRPGADLDALHDHLTTCSGFALTGRAGASGRVSVDEVVDRFFRHADALKAHAAMGRIRALGRLCALEDIATVGALLDEVDDRRELSGSLRELRIFAACAAMSRGDLHLSDEMTDELLAFARSADVARQLGCAADAPASVLAEAARTASSRWRSVAMLAGPTTGGQRARDVAGFCEDVYFDLAAGDPPAGVDDSIRHPLRALAGAPFVSEVEARACTALAAASVRSDTVDGALTDGRDLARVARSYATLFRGLGNRPFLDVEQRRAVRGACDFYELMAERADPGGHP